jgi:hypothetical protein
MVLARGNEGPKRALGAQLKDRAAHSRSLALGAHCAYVHVFWRNHGQPLTAAEVNALRSAALLD